MAYYIKTSFRFIHLTHDIKQTAWKKFSIFNARIL